MSPSPAARRRWRWRPAPRSPRPGSGRSSPRSRRPRRAPPAARRTPSTPASRTAVPGTRRAAGTDHVGRHVAGQSADEHAGEQRRVGAHQDPLAAPAVGEDPRGHLQQRDDQGVDAGHDTHGGGVEAELGHEQLRPAPTARGHPGPEPRRAAGPARPRRPATSGAKDVSLAVSGDGGGAHGRLRGSGHHPYRSGNPRSVTPAATGRRSMGSARAGLHGPWRAGTPAVDEDVDAGEEAGLVRQQEGDDGGQLVGPGPPGRGASVAPAPPCTGGPRPPADPAGCR